MAYGQDSVNNYELPSYDFGGGEQENNQPSPQEPTAPQQPQAPVYAPQAPQGQPYYPNYQPQPNPQAPVYAPQYPQQPQAPQEPAVEDIVRQEFTKREITDIGKQSGFTDAHTFVNYYDMLIQNAEAQAAITGDRTKAEAGKQAITLFQQGRNREAAEILTKTFGYGPLYQASKPQPQTQTFGNPPQGAQMQAQSGKIFKSEADYNNFRLHGTPEQIRQAKTEMDKWAAMGELPWDGWQKGFS